MPQSEYQHARRKLTVRNVRHEIHQVSQMGRKVSGSGGDFSCEKETEMQENEYDSTKRSYTVHRLRRSVRALIGPKKEDTTLKREKNGSYYGHVWLDRELYQGLSFFARVNHVTLKEATRQALRAGLSRLLGDGIRESTRREAALREQGLPAKPTPLTREIKRRAKARGFHLGEDL